MELQHLVIKIPVQGTLGIDPAKIVDVFHRWVAMQAVPGLVLVDVAELLHVPDGPGVLAVGVEADFSLDHTGGLWGALYRRKSVLSGSDTERLQQAFESAGSAASALEEEFAPNLKFSRTQFELVINDRGIAPNTAATYEAAIPAIEAALKSILGHSNFTLAKNDGNPRQRFAVSVTSAKPFALASAIAV